MLFWPHPLSPTDAFTPAVLSPHNNPSPRFYIGKDTSAFTEVTTNRADMATAPVAYSEVAEGFLSALSLNHFKPFELINVDRQHEGKSTYAAHTIALRLSETGSRSPSGEATRPWSAAAEDLTNQLPDLPGRASFVNEFLTRKQQEAARTGHTHHSLTICASNGWTGRPLRGEELRPHIDLSSGDTADLPPTRVQEVLVGRELLLVAPEAINLPRWLETDYYAGEVSHSLIPLPTLGSVAAHTRRLPLRATVMFTKLNNRNPPEKWGAGQSPRPLIHAVPPGNGFRLTAGLNSI